MVLFINSLFYFVLKIKTLAISNVCKKFKASAEKAGLIKILSIFLVSNFISNTRNQF